MPDNSSQTIINGGFGSPNGMSGQEVSSSYWQQGDVIGDWFRHQDTFAHNEALASYEREKQAAAEAFERESSFNAREAEKQREWEEMMSNTAFQRKAADMAAAGFSPLAVLGSASGASTPSGSAATATGHKASAPAASRGPNSFGSVITSTIAALGLLMTKGISAFSNAAANNAKATAALSNLVYGGAKEGAKDAHNTFAKELADAQQAAKEAAKKAHIDKMNYLLSEEGMEKLYEYNKKKRGY